MAALLLEQAEAAPGAARTKRRGWIYAPSPDLEEEGARGAQETIRPSRARSRSAREMARSAGALAPIVEQEAVRWALAILGCAAARRDLVLSISYPFLPQWAPTVLGSVAEAALTLLFGWYAWRLFETSSGLSLSREERGAESRARTVQPLLRSCRQARHRGVALMGALSSLGLNICAVDRTWASSGSRSALAPRRW